ncbi:helix-turn-helix domain-containing protein [Candidatus Uhrbacteria bacterium]|nr:helix-turn-helix domain-containing protein [Candidatus Uhrbacteria bacterium]
MACSGESNAGIARRLGRYASTVSREIRQHEGTTQDRSMRVLHETIHPYVYPASRQFQKRTSQRSPRAAPHFYKPEEIVAKLVA